MSFIFITLLLRYAMELAYLTVKIYLYTMKKLLPNILLCEDDVNYGMLLQDFLKEKQYNVSLAANGEEGWQMYQRAKYDMIILDVMMPKKDGFSLASDIRAIDQRVPIIFLTQRDTTQDILRGYAVGCDDYVVKPCAMDVLLCKIEAILKRVKKQIQNGITEFDFGIFHFDSIRQNLTWESEKVHLSSRESEVLTLLAQNINQITERDIILTQVWRNNDYYCSRSLSVYINHLRNHLEADKNIQIMSVHGKGYKLVVNE